MFDGREVVQTLKQLGVTHVVWLPDSEIGAWESALVAEPSIRLVRACREGEVLGITAGLIIGGARPVAMIQCTGMFEAGDALRNVVHDLGLPLFLVIGYRSYLDREKIPNDSAREFAEPILKAWRIPYRLLERAEQLRELAEQYRESQAKGTAAAVLVAE